MSAQTDSPKLSLESQTQSLATINPPINYFLLQLLLHESVPMSIRVVSDKQHSTDNRPIPSDKQTTDNHTVPSDKHTTENLTPFHPLDSPLANSPDVAAASHLMGYTVGRRLCLLLLHSAPADSSNAMDLLAIVKFVCRTVWRLVYNKPIDNLRTNHRGTFVLLDANHRTILAFDLPRGVVDTHHKARLYLHWPCGLVRGALAALGLDASVVAELQFPQVTFQVNTAVNN